MNNQQWQIKKENLSSQIRKAVEAVSNPSLTYVERNVLSHQLVRLHQQMAEHKTKFVKE